MSPKDPFEEPGFESPLDSLAVERLFAEQIPVDSDEDLEFVDWLLGELEKEAEERREEGRSPREKEYGDGG